MKTVIEVHNKFAEATYKLIEWLDYHQNSGFTLEIKVNKSCNQGSMPSPNYAKRLITGAIKKAGTKHKVLKIKLDKLRRIIYAEIAYADKWFVCAICHETYPMEATKLQNGQLRYCAHCVAVMKSLE